MALAPREFADMIHPLHAALARLADEGSRLVEESITRSDGFELLKVGQPYPADIYETPNGYLVEVAIPGIRPQEVRIAAAARAITLRGEPVEGGGRGERGEFVLRERYAGELDRTLRLPGVIDPARVTAVVEYGVLRLRAPKAEEVTPHEIAARAEEPTHLKRTAPIR